MLDDVVDAAELTSHDTVLEVGPGLGVLTRALAARVDRVVAVELDPSMLKVLEDTIGGYPNVTLVKADVLTVDPAVLFGKAAPLEDTPRPQAEVPTIPSDRYKIVANLPYYITQPTLRHFLEARFKPVSIVVMVQKEVAQRIVARPGQLTLLAVSVQVYGRPRIVRMVTRESFFPQPEVDSAVLRIDLFDRPAVDVDDLDEFFKLVSAGFSQPRKQIHNAISQRLWFPPGGASEVLQRARVEPERRAQTLDLAEWELLYRAWRQFIAQQPTV